MDISQIRDIRFGVRVSKENQRLREILNCPTWEEVAERTVTVVFGTDFVNTNFLHFSTENVETAKVRE